MIPEGICEVAIKGGDTLGRADDIGIVEKRKHALAWLQCGCNGVKGGVLGDCRKMHRRILTVLKNSACAGGSCCSRRSAPHAMAASRTTVPARHF